MPLLKKKKKRCQFYEKDLCVYWLVGVFINQAWDLRLFLPLSLSLKWFHWTSSLVCLLWVSFHRLGKSFWLVRSVSGPSPCLVGDISLLLLLLSSAASACSSIPSFSPHSLIVFPSLLSRLPAPLMAFYFHFLSILSFNLLLFCDFLFLIFVPWNQTRAIVFLPNGRMFLSLLNFQYYWLFILTNKKNIWECPYQNTGYNISGV